MLGLHGRPCEVDVFAFQLAEALHMTVGQIQETMSLEEYAQWHSYMKIKNLIADKKAV